MAGCWVTRPVAPNAKRHSTPPSSLRWASGPRMPRPWWAGNGCLGSLAVPQSSAALFRPPVVRRPGPVGPTDRRRPLLATLPTQDAGTRPGGRLPQAPSRPTPPVSTPPRLAVPKDRPLPLGPLAGMVLGTNTNS